MTSPAVEPFDPFLPELRADPYPVYHRYREASPVHWCPPGESAGTRGAWYLFRYADVTRVLRDPRFVREARRVLPAESFPPIPESQRAFWETTDRWILFRDPPDHTRLRSLVNRAFSPGVVETRRRRIERVADELLDAVAGASELDLLRDFAFPLPVIVIAELLGVPPQDRDRVKLWSARLTAALDMKPTRMGYESGSEAVLEFTAYLREIIAQRRRHPQDDLISRLIASETEGGKLSEDELVSNSILLVFAGHETTVNLIGNGMLALLQHADQLALLRRRPELLPGAVDELLRYDAPVQVTRRLPLEDVELGRHLIRRGQEARLLLGAANRDPEVYPDPDRLDITRTGPLHNSFGLGIHFCLGAPLARAEAAIAIAALLRRFPALRLLDEAPAWRDTVGLRGLVRLRVGL
ncbi:MAG TPA: cytochrome P450 [Gemmatimonadales bacterium]